MKLSRALVPSATLDWSSRSGPARDPRSLEPSEASEQLLDLFNREGAVPWYIVPSLEARGRIALSQLQRDASFQGIPSCDRGSTGVALVGSRNKCAAAAPAASLQCEI
jgi:hypothetical protein